MYRKLSEKDQYILLCCFFIFFINGLYSMVLGSLLPLLSSSYKLNDTVSGLLLSGHQIGNLMAGFIAGVLPLYLGRKKSILFLSSFVILGFLMIISTGNPLFLIIAFFFTGISRGSISNFNNQTVNDISNSSPVALNLLHSLFAVGALISPFLIVIATNVFDEAGWKLVCILFIILVFISQIMFKRMQVEEIPKNVLKKVKDYSFFKRASFWNTVQIIFFYLCAESAITGWIVKYLVDMNILTIKAAQLVSSLLWLSILIGRLICASLSQRLSKSTLLMITSFVTAFFYILLMTSSEQSIVITSIIGLGLFMGGIFPTALTIAGSSIKEFPMAMGWLLIIGGIGGIMMPIIIGIVSDSYSPRTGMATIILAIFMMLVGVIWFYLSEKKKKVRS